MLPLLGFLLLFIHLHDVDGAAMRRAENGTAQIRPDVSGPPSIPTQPSSNTVIASPPSTITVIPPSATAASVISTDNEVGTAIPPQDVQHTPSTITISTASIASSTNLPVQASSQSISLSSDNSALSISSLALSAPLSSFTLSSDSSSFSRPSSLDINTSKIMDTISSTGTPTTNSPWISTSQPLERQSPARPTSTISSTRISATSTIMIKPPQSSSNRVSAAAMPFSTKSQTEASSSSFTLPSIDASRQSPSSSAWSTRSSLLFTASNVLPSMASSLSSSVDLEKTTSSALETLRSPLGSSVIATSTHDAPISSATSNTLAYLLASSGSLSSIISTNAAGQSTITTRPTMIMPAAMPPASSTSHKVSNDQQGGGGPTTATSVGVGVGVGVPSAAFVVFIGAFYLLRRRRNSNDERLLSMPSADGGDNQRPHSYYMLTTATRPSSSNRDSESAIYHDQETPMADRNSTIRAVPSNWLVIPGISPSNISDHDKQRAPMSEMVRASRQTAQIPANARPFVRGLAPTLPQLAFLNSLPQDQAPTRWRRRSSTSLHSLETQVSRGRDRPGSTILPETHYRDVSAERRTAFIERATSHKSVVPNHEVTTPLILQHRDLKPETKGLYGNSLTVPELDEEEFAPSPGLQGLAYTPMLDRSKWGSRRRSSGTMPVGWQWTAG